MTDRPEYVHCVLTGMWIDGLHQQRESWCGLPVGQFDWVFLNASHAVLSKKQNTYATPCELCCKAIADVLLDKGDFKNGL